MSNFVVDRIILRASRASSVPRGVSGHRWGRTGLRGSVEGRWRSSEVNSQAREGKDAIAWDTVKPWFSAIRPYFGSIREDSSAKKSIRASTDISGSLGESRIRGIVGQASSGGGTLEISFSSLHSDMCSASSRATWALFARRRYPRVLQHTQECPSIGQSVRGSQIRNRRFNCGGVAPWHFPNRDSTKKRDARRQMSRIWLIRWSRKYK